MTVQIKMGNHGTAAPSLFDPCLLSSNGWMDQDAIWYGGTCRPTVLWGSWVPIVLHGNPAPP